MSAGGDLQQRDSQLRACIACGLCLPHCATYLASGNEALSPRGRLQLLGEILGGRLPADDPAARRAFALCLGCLACTAVCPSAVSGDLMAYLQGLGVAQSGRSRFAPAALLDRAVVLRALRKLAALARQGLAAGSGSTRLESLARAPQPLAGLARLLLTLPSGPGDARQLCRLLSGRSGRTAAPPIGDLPRPAGGAVKERIPSAGVRVAWFEDCAAAALLPATAERLRDLFAAHGCEVVTVAAQACCGAVASRTARRERAGRLRSRNSAAFAEPCRTCDHVVVAAAGCSRELRTYPPELADKIIEPTVLLDRLLPPRLGTVPLRVAIHDPCHLRHGQNVSEPPRRLLRRIGGLSILEPAEPDVCCGGAGIYNLEHPALARDMGRRKALMLAATGCQLVVTTDPGCLGQIAAGLAQVAPSVPILPLTDLVWYAWRLAAPAVGP